METKSASDCRLAGLPDCRGCGEEALSLRRCFPGKFARAENELLVKFMVVIVISFSILISVHRTIHSKQAVKTYIYIYIHIYTHINTHVYM